MNNKKKKLLLIGGGGHCKSILDTLYRCNLYEEIGVVDKAIHANKILDSYLVGTDDALPVLFEQGYTDAFVSAGSIGNPALRKKLFSKILEIGFDIPNIIDPTAYVSTQCHLGKGIFFGKRVVVNTSVEIDNAAIVNTGVIIEHDCKIGSFVHLAPGATICGDVSIGCDSHIGANATVIQGLEVGSNVLIGAGSVVTKSIKDYKKYCGVPAKEI